MRKLTLAVAVVFACGLLSGPALLQQQRGGEDETGPYEVVPNWPQPLARPGYALGSQGGVFAESPNRIILVNRGEIKLPEKLPNDFTGAYGAIGSALTAKVEEMRNCIIIVDGAGKMIESWTQWDKLFQGGRGPHKVKISPYDPQRHVWVIDDLRQQVFKFTHDGKQLVMTLGEAGVAGTDEKHFGRPTDIAWLPDGTFFISDGYTNTRVMKFDKRRQVPACSGGPPAPETVSSTPCTRLTSIGTAVCMSPIGGTGGSRSSTRTASISTSSGAFASRNTSWSRRTETSRSSAGTTTSSSSTTSPER